MKRLATLLLPLACAAWGADFDVRAFGAKGDGATKDTAAVQLALDACAQAGGGRVTVPPGTYLIGSVYLGDRTELHIREGATLLGSPDLADYTAPDAYPQNWGRKNEGWSAKHLILALEKRGVSITGRGAIDGNGRAFFDDKPQFVGKICWRDGGVNARDRAHQGRPGQEIVFIECRDVAVRDVTLRDMSCWSCFFHGCENVAVGGVTVRNDLTHLNTDGFDVDSCRNVDVGDCDIVTGDDAIAIRGSPAHLKDPAKVCENVRVSNIVCRVSADGMRVGVGNGTIRNLRVSDMKIEHAGRGLHLQCVYGKPGPKGVDISDISFERVSIRDAAEAIHVGVGSETGAATLADIRFSHVSAEGLAPPRLRRGARAVRRLRRPRHARQGRHVYRLFVQRGAARGEGSAARRRGQGAPQRRHRRVPRPKRRRRLLRQLHLPAQRHARDRSGPHLLAPRRRDADA